MKTVCVFCASSPGARDIYRTSARRLAAELVERNIGIVYGGGRAGLMGELAAEALEAGGRVTGVIPEHLMERESALPGLTALHVVPDIHARKKLMSELAEGFIALPGGFGTLEEMMEALSWAELGLHCKPCGLLDVAGFYQLFLDFLDDAVAAGFLRRQSRNLLYVERKPYELVDALCSHGVGAGSKP
jgi:uncharacterized protein (TIGR00730 family)